MNKNYKQGYKLYHEKEYEEAYRYFLLAAEDKYPLAYLSLAKMYHRGRGIEKSYEKAFYYYQEASKYNIGEAYYFIAELYYKGIKDNIEINKVLENYELAIKNHYEKALIKYVEVSIENNLLEDKNKLKRYLDLAISNGSDKAKLLKMKLK